MLISYVLGSSNGSFETDATSISLESLLEIFASENIHFELDQEKVVHYSYQSSTGRNKGDFTENTVFTPPTGVVIITQQPKTTKARAYSDEEIQDIIASAKDALVSQEYKALRSACRELSNVSTEVKELVGNYTHYTISSRVEAVERAIKFLSPDVLEVDVEDLQEIFARIEAIEAKVSSLVNETAVEDTNLAVQVHKIKEDLAFVANHFDIMLPNHKELFVVK